MVYGWNVKLHEIYRVLKDDLNMSYHRVQHVALHGNSVRNHILRQRWALEFIRLFEDGSKTLINVDETWIDTGDYRR